ncbi:S-adenosyl-L-methionine-dependent methyltransferase [Halteromyces radiatus]|uniref:S-adenosyl-L-methionine-dependent methyltransferase n=1 Tax=Halteromyces radiatus TaxID=101107 RepID=UPI00221EAC7B|nr:S-adenosyl-L-methionine-dependent methyltransferase [Halteromyces radiatus]KAI8092609.1 S-adenosyl-L-methionine-dependent methyltransferase [Halteromyces radiatus]
MGSSQSKRLKEPSISSSSSHRRSVAPGSSTPTSTSSNNYRTTSAIKSRSSFIRPSTSNTTNNTLSSSCSKQQQLQLQQQQSSSSTHSLTRPPIFTGLQSNSFFLPKNWQAEDADHNLHFALKQLFASNVLSLALPKFIKNACIIELGCHRGSWILDMATQFPECQFIGFDTNLERLPDGLPVLPNVSFQVGNVANGRLPLEDESVDVVNLRAQNSFMDHHAWRRTFEEAHRVLKPGGLIHIIEYNYKPSGSVLIESFTETVRGIMVSLNRDTDRATKLGAQLSSFGFQVIQSISKKVHYGSGEKLGETFTGVSLHRFEEMSSILAPAMGLSLDDYRHRVEMVVAQCVNTNSFLTWYAYLARKVSSTSPPSAGFQV